MSEPALRRVSNGADALTVRQVLHLPLNPKLLTCAVMRAEVASERAMRLVGAAIASDVLDRHAARGTYIDFRSRRAVDAARAFANGASSLGEFARARSLAERAQSDVMELADDRVAAAAAISVSSCDADAASAVARVVGDALDNFESTDDQHHVIRIIERTLEEAGE